MIKKAKIMAGIELKDTQNTLSVVKTEIKTGTISKDDLK